MNDNPKLLAVIGEMFIKLRGLEESLGDTETEQEKYQEAVKLQLAAERELQSCRELVASREDRITQLEEIIEKQMEQERQVREEADRNATVESRRMAHALSAREAAQEREQKAKEELSRVSAENEKLREQAEISSKTIAALKEKVKSLATKLTDALSSSGAGDPAELQRLEKRNQALDDAVAVTLGHVVRAQKRWEEGDDNVDRSLSLARTKLEKVAKPQ